LAHAAASLLRAIDLLDAELTDLQERVTAHLAAIPGSWGADAGGVTGPGAGRAADAAALPAAERLDEIPGLGREAAAALIAEIGLDMSRFPTPQALVSWAGLTDLHRGWRRDPRRIATVRWPTSEPDAFPCRALDGMGVSDHESYYHR